MIGQAAGDNSLWTQQGANFVRNINIGSIIGTIPSGQTTSWLRVIVNSAGEVISAYPVEAPPYSPIP